VTYSATDPSGNSASATTVVTVSDTTAPAITVTGGTTATVECHTSYVEAGATASDSCGGSQSVTTSGSVDANTVGVYTITYSSTDASGNSATATRVVTVSDTTAPVVSVSGGTETVECHTSYADAGASASDSCTGSLTPSTSGSVDVNTTGDYTLTYSSTDASGNTGTATRTVHVTDTTAPTVSVTGGTVTVECHGSYSESGATASDSCAGSLSVSTSGSVDANTVGDYTVTYSATDASGNSATATRTVHVTDTTSATVTVTGSTTVTVECHTSYSEDGATASDGCTGSLSVTTTGSVDANTVGDYTVTYSATDASGNTADATRTVHVTDTTAPSVTVTGGTVTVECHGSYSEAGASASDSCEGSQSVTTSGTVDANTVGDYTVTYSATDTSGNTGTATRTVHVTDTTAPVVTLSGSATMGAVINSTFSDPGASANDSCAGSLDVTTTGTVDTSTQGDYTLTYSATDPSGNSASVTRVVTVAGAPVIVVQPSNLLKQPQGTNITFSVTATSDSDGPFYQWKVNGNAISGATDSSYSTTAQPIGGSTNLLYSVDVSNAAATITSTNARLTILVDAVGPKVAITKPGTSKQYATNSYVAYGTATDNKNVNRVTVALNGGTPVDATLGGTLTSRTWTNVITPVGGTNTISVTVYDLAGNSVTTNRTFVVGIYKPFTLTINGSGKVAGANLTKGDPAYKLPYLVDGDSYKLTATPNSGNVFSNFVSTLGGTVSNNTYTFTMSEGAAVTVNFAVSPFVAGAGTYNGLYSDNVNGVTVDSAGLLQNFALQNTGTGSGKLLTGLSSLTVKGKFNNFGHLTTNVITGSRTLTVDLQLDNETKQLTGTISDTTAGWSSPIAADKAGLSPLTAGAKYTVHFAPDANQPTTTPAGYGFADVTVTAGKGVAFTTGAMAFTPRTLTLPTFPVSKDGTVPFFVQVNAAVGQLSQLTILHGLLTVNTNSSTIAGTVDMIRGNIGSGLYPDGFHSTNEVTGYAYASATPVIALTGGTLEIDEPETAEVLSWTVNVDSLNKVVRTGGSTNTFTGSIAPATGLVTIKYRPTGTGATVTKTVTAMVNQPGNSAKGFNPGTTHSGLVDLH